MSIHEVYACLRVRGAPAAIAFYEKAFGAKEKYRLTEPGGRVGHAELDFGSAVVMLSEEFPEMGVAGPQSPGGMRSDIHLHVDDADAAIRCALEAGAQLVREPADQFWGERMGRIRDPFGHEWTLGHEIEKVSPDEMQRRYDALFR